MTRQRGAVAFQPQDRQHRLERIMRHRRLGPPGRRAGSGTAAAAERRGRCGSRRHGACWPRREPGRLRVLALRASSGSKGGRPQFCPCGPSGSGGAPTDSPAAKRSGRRPDFRSAAIGADRKIAVEADAHARRLRAARQRPIACPRAIAARHGRRCVRRARSRSRAPRLSGRRGTGPANRQATIGPLAGNAPTEPRTSRELRAPRLRSGGRRRKPNRRRGREKSAHNASRRGRFSAQTRGMVDERRSRAAQRGALGTRAFKRAARRFR